MDSSTTQLLSILVIVLALVVVAVLPRRRYTLRPIQAYQDMTVFPGRMIESSKPMHLSLGSAGIGGESTLLAVASAELAYHLARRAAMGDGMPILTLSSASALPLGQDTLRRAYQSRGRIAAYKSTGVRWYPAGSRSLAFAAAVTTMMRDDEISANVLGGSYGPELSLMIDAAQRRDIPVVAVSDQLEGQAVAYALADAPLIGEEVFASESYLGDETAPTSESIAIDVLRWLTVLALLVGLIANILEGR